MARILICHVPKDAGAARDIGAMLMGRGHFVSFDGEPETPRPDRSARLKQFEAVVVIWTESSMASSGLARIARETLPLNLLVPIRHKALPVSALPLVFRKLNMYAPEDADGISRFIARLSTASSTRAPPRHDARGVANGRAPGRGDQVRGAKWPIPASDEADNPGLGITPGGNRKLNQLIKALPLADSTKLVETAEVDPQRHENTLRADRAATRAKPQPPKANANKSLLSPDEFSQLVDAGLLLVRIPHDMARDHPGLVEVILGQDVLAEIEHAFVEEAQGNTNGNTAIETISVSLYGEGFDIERQSERTQFINARVGNVQGRWAWLVTPRIAGQQEVIVRISALLRDKTGVPTPIALPDRGYYVAIHDQPGFASSA